MTSVIIILLDFPADIGRKPALPARGSRQRLYASESQQHTCRREPATHTPANEAANIAQHGVARKEREERK